MLLVLRFWPLPALALICGVSWAVVRLVVRVPARRARVETLFAGYTGALLYIVFLLPVRVRPDEAGSIWSAVNLVPTHTIVGIIRDHPGMVTWQLLGNVALFVPLGFLLPLLSARCRRFAVTAAVGLSVSVGIEFAQLAMLLSLVSRRSVDVDDVILNVMGVCIGYLIWRGTFEGTGRPGVGSRGAGQQQADSCIRDVRRQAVVRS